MTSVGLTRVESQLKSHDSGKHQQVVLVFLILYLFSLMLIPSLDLMNTVNAHAQRRPMQTAAVQQA